MDGWNTSFLLGGPICRGELLVSGSVSNVAIHFLKYLRTYGAAEGLGRAEIVVATANLLAYVKAEGTAEFFGKMFQPCLFWIS